MAGSLRPAKVVAATTRSGAGVSVPASSRYCLSGLWLEQLGFAIGSKLQITARDGELVLSMAGRDPESEHGSV